MNIGLVMIIKNERDVLARCLHSVKDHVTHALIVDTGSTAEQDIDHEHIIREELDHLEDNVIYIHRPWIDFAHNRTEALRLAEYHNPECGYHLVIDADDVLAPDTDPKAFDNLTFDGYHVNIVHRNIRFPRLQILKADGGWRYRGALHEFADRAAPMRLGSLPVDMLTTRGGHRSADPSKYQKDVATLELAIATKAEPELEARYTFYLAQSYRDVGDDYSAANNYFIRAQLGGYKEEIYISYLELARIAKRQGEPVDQIVTLCRSAGDVCPHRLEAAHLAALTLREANRFEEAVKLCRNYPNREIWAGTLFVEPAIYNYMMDDEHGVSAYWVGNYKESVSYSIRALEHYTDLDIDTRRMIANVRWALTKHGMLKNGTD